jgi:hypothetical protein
MKLRLAATSVLAGGAALLGAACGPMQVGLVVDRVAYVGVPGPGGAGIPLTLTGRAFCSEPEALDLFVTVTQNPDRRFHGERTIYCEGDTPFAETFQGTSFTTEESALLDARLCTNRGLEDIHEDCVAVTRTLLIQPK